MNDMVKLSVVIPAYNEGEHIFDNLLKTEEILSGFCDSFEIICVNDGSRDNTYDEILRAVARGSNLRCISYEENGGKGKAIKTGCLAAKGQYIAFLDADMDLSPTHLRSFLERMEEGDVDIVIGSKMHPDSVLDYPFTRRIMSYGYYIMLLCLFRLKVHDTQTGVKLFKSELLQKIIEDIQTRGFAYDIEILAIANLYGARIAEMPIVLNFSRETGFSRIGMGDIVKVFKDTFAIHRKINKMRKRLKNGQGSQK